MNKFTLQFFNKKIASGYETLFYTSKHRLFTISLFLLSIYGFGRLIENIFTDL